MSPTSLLLLLIGTGGILVSLHLYRRVEVPVAGRDVLLALRLGSLGLLTLILVNPAVPGTAPEEARSGGPPWVLLDPDLSLGARDEEGRPLWEEAVTRAAAAAERGAPLSVLGPPGAGPEGIDLPSLVARGPSHPTGDLLAGIRTLAEAGADTIRVLGTFRSSPTFLERLEGEAPVPLILERIGGPVRNAGVAELDLPVTLRAGEAPEGRLVIFHEGAAPGDTASVEIRADGALVGTLQVPLEEGRGRSEAPLRLAPAADSGQVRYSARVRLAGDRFPDDDERVRRVRVGEPEGGIIFVSLRPDWEPRTLLPVLEAVTGLPGEGFLLVGDGLFLPLASGEGPSEPARPQGLAVRMARARILVVHGVEGEAPDWLRDVVESHSRVLHLPGGPGGARLGGVEVGTPRRGEWTLDPELPPTVVVSFLDGVPLGGLPPLTDVMPPAPPRAGAPDPSPGVPAVLARNPEGGPSVPVILLRESPGGRRVVALAGGFWRWGVRTGEARRAYRGLWAGTMDWLLARPGVVTGPEIRPADQVQARGRPLEWSIPAGLEEVDISLSPDPSAPGDPAPPAFQGTLAPDEEGRARTPPLPPGTYRYRARSVRSVGGDEVEHRGMVEVEDWVPSLVLPPLEVPARILPPRDGGLRPEVPRGRPFRTFALPWLLILALLCAEWVGRRRLGFR